jgi:hypothetical protein
MVWRRQHFLRMHRAAICIQSFYRMYVRRREYLQIRHTIVLLQARVRANCVRNNLQKVRLFCSTFPHAVTAHRHVSHS